MTVLFVLVTGFAADPIAEASAKVAKLYGAGAGRVEAYGSGVIVSPDGRIVTALTGMLQGESITAVFADGRRRPVKLLAADSVSGLAILKAEGLKTPFFDLAASRIPEVGEVIYALSNQFNIAAGDEPVSVQRGIIAGKSKLTGRVGVRDAATKDDVLLVDVAMNNPGSAGGALVDAKGNLVGLIGRELRNAATETWIHHAIPARSLVAFNQGSKSTSAPPIPPSGDAARAKSDLRGIIPLPNWLDRTAPFVDSIESASPAAEAGLRSDDLVMFVDGRLVGSVVDLQNAFAAAAPSNPIKLTVKRGKDLVDVSLRARSQ